MASMLLGWLILPSLVRVIVTLNLVLPSFGLSAFDVVLHLVPTSSFMPTTSHKKYEKGKTERASQIHHACDL